MEQVARPARLLRFGVYEIDLEAGKLHKSGRRVPLQEQPFQVLALLLTHPGRLLTREELQNRIWPADTFVDFDLGLNTAIKKIRAALGDSADNPTFIETLHRRGYRFLCPVEDVPSSTRVALPESESLASAESRFGPQVPVNSSHTASRSHTRLWLALGSLAVFVLVAGLTFYQLRDRVMHSGRTQNELEKLGERGTQNPAAYGFYSKGRNLLQADGGPEQNDEAIQEFDQAIKADPLYALAYGLRGETYMRKYKATSQNLWKVRAQTDCDKAMDMDATRPAGHICQGALDNGMGLYKQAVKDFSEAIAIDPISARAYIGRAWAFQESDQIADAEKDYLKAIDLEPGKWRWHRALANLYLNNSRYDEAAKKYELAIKLKPDDSGLYSSLGAAYELMGKYDQAVANLNKANAMQASFPAYENLGLCFLNTRNFPDAIKSFQAAITLANPNDYRGYGTLARAYFWAPGKRELALQTYKRAIELAEQQLTVNPDDADVNLMLAVYHAMLGEEKSALYHLDLARRSQPDVPEVVFWAAVVNQQLGRRARALALLRQARSLKYSYADIMGAPELDSLHADPEFRLFMSAGSTSVAHSANSELHKRSK